MAEPEAEMRLYEPRTPRKRIGVQRNSSVRQPTVSVNMETLENTAIPAPDNPPNAHDWELRRPLITRLYRDDDKSLREVMDVIQRSGFRASSKVFQSRIQQWGLNKKLKEPEARAIIHLLARHRGRASCIRLRGRRVEVQAIESLLKRKGITISDVLSTNAPHVSNLIYKTPDMSPKPMSKMRDPGTAANNGVLQVDAGRAVPRCLTIPDVFRLTELLCADVREYVLSSFGTGAWLPQSLDSDRGSEESLKSVMDSYRTHHNILFACRENKPGVAVKEIREGLANLKKFTLWRNFDILPLTIQVIATVLMRRPRPTATMLSKQLCFIAASLDFGEGHPIVYLQKIFTRIGRIAYNDETPDYLLAIIRSSIDSHEHVLGQYHLQTLRNTAALSRTMCILYGTDGLFEPLEALRSSLESQQGPDTRESRFLRNELYMLGELHDLGS